MDLNEKTIDRTVIYNGKIVDVEIHTVTLPNGETSTRELVYHNGAVAVCAVTPKKEVVLVKQYRKPVEKPLLEIPAGKLEDIENVKSMLMNKEIEDAKTIIALQHLLLNYNHSK
ncbi:TPA: NUDIX hydrolase [Staphylococcus aureus]|nr:NUDIX hydrolase [Staphylococcus aureus]